MLGKKMISNLKRLIESDDYRIYRERTVLRTLPKRPATPSEIDRAEKALGAELPPLLRRIYLEVANGGLYFDFALMGVPMDGDDDPDIVSSYPGATLPREELREGLVGYRTPHPDDPEAIWPASLVAFTDPRSGPKVPRYALLCDRPAYPVVQFDPHFAYEYMLLHLRPEDLFEGAKEVYGGSWIQFDSLDRVIEDGIRHVYNTADLIRRAPKSHLVHCHSPILRDGS